MTLMRAYTGQLVTSPTVEDFAPQLEVVPALATVLHTRENGGFSADYVTWTFHLRTGVRWNTDPPRVVTAADVVRNIKLQRLDVIHGGRETFPLAERIQAIPLDQVSREIGVFATRR